MASTPDTAQLLEGLNAAQIEAVSAPPAPTLVIAGPGSGKTAVLTRRVAYLIREMGVPPRRIMAVTFTNKAAKEMQERITHLLGGKVDGLQTGTFHAICARILRREAEYVGLTRDYVIYDTDDQVTLMKRVIEGANLDPKAYPPRGQLHKISNAKNELIGPAEYPAGTYADQLTRDLYERYQDALRMANAADFDDLLMKVVLLFQQNPAVLTRYKSYYDHILVDEFQDTNTAQYAMLKLLASSHCHLFCVGDPDQSIYKFRGADFRNVQRFREDFPEARMILLEHNYRSHQLILDAAMSIIDKAPDRIRKQLTTSRKEGPKITFRESTSEDQEAQWVVEKIVELTYTKRYKLRDCAVMYRTNAQSRSLEEAFLQMRVPYRLIGATRFYSRKEIKDVLAYLKVIYNPDDDISMDRIINVPPRGIGAKTVAELRVWAGKQNQSMYRALRQIAQGVVSPLTGRASKALVSFTEMIEKWQDARENATVGPLMDDVLARTGYLAFLDDGTPEGQDRIDNVKELSKLAHEGNYTLGEFLTEISLVSDVDTTDESGDAAVLLTLHAAKGLEFPVVFIVGMEEGVLPHQRALDDPEQMDEERRLIYVGVTRAKDLLHLTWTFMRSSYYGDSMRAIPSRFLGEIPQNLTTGSSLPARARGMTEREGYQRATTWNIPMPPNKPRTTAPAAPTSERAAKFHSGQRVSHPAFGEGVVIASKVRGDDEEVDIKFDQHRGVKRLSAAIANLKPVNGK